LQGGDYSPEFTKLLASSPYFYLYG